MPSSTRVIQYSFKNLPRPRAATILQRQLKLWHAAGIALLDADGSPILPAHPALMRLNPEDGAEYGVLFPGKDFVPQLVSLPVAEVVLNPTSTRMEPAFMCSCTTVTSTCYCAGEGPAYLAAPHRHWQGACS